MRHPFSGSLVGLALLLSACGGGAASSPAAPSSPLATSAGPAGAGSAAGIASPKPAGGSAGAAANSPTGASSPAGSAKPTGAAASATGASGKPAAGVAAASGSASAKPATGASAAASAKPGSNKITVAITDTPTVWPAYLANDENIFQKYGVDVTLLVVQGAPVAVAGLSSGDIQISTFGSTIIDADPTGRTLAFIGAFKNEYDQFSMWAKPSFKDVKSLTGATFAGSSPGAAATMAARAIFKRSGMDPDKDVKWTFAQNTAAQLAVLTTNQVDATILSWPTSLDAQKAGYVMVADAKPMHIPAASSTFSTSRAWVQANPTAVSGFLKGMIEAMSIVNSDKARAEASLGKRLKVTDQAELDEAYARYVPYTNPPYMTPEAAMEGITDSPNEQARGHQPSDYLENGPLDAVVKSGFADQFVKK
jgi:ABC-type nitrate/sulfonate/bicarbonate transport system substrate-binding protein